MKTTGKRVRSATRKKPGTHSAKSGSTSRGAANRSVANHTFTATKMNTRELEQALRRSDQRLRTTFDSMLEGCVIISPEVRFLYVNGAAAAQAQRTKEQLLGRLVTEVLPDIENTELLSVLRRCLVEQSPQRAQSELILPDGSKGWFELSIQPVPEGILLFSTDITERKRAEEALQATTQLLGTILDSTNMMFAYMDPEFNFVRVNRAYAEADERESAFFPGKNHFTLYPNTENEAIFRHVVETGTPHFAAAKPFEYAEHPERGVSSWDWSLVPVKNPEGAVTGLVLTVVNVTERKRAEEELRESEERFRLVLENSMDAILLTAPDGSILSANPAAGEIFQRTQEEICRIGRNGLVDIHDPRLPVLLEERARTGKARGELTMIRSDGSGFQVELSTSVFVDRSGEQRTSMIIHDITERKQAERALREARERIQGIFDSSPDAIYLIDLKGIVLECNQTTVNMHGYSTKAELLGTSGFNLVIERQRQRAMELLQELLSQGTAHDVELTMLRRDGSEFIAVTAGSVLRDPSGNPIGLVVIASDITERKQAEKALLVSQDEYRNLVETAHDLIFAVDPRGIITFINQASKKIYGYAPEELIGRSFMDFQTPDERLRAIESFPELLATGVKSVVGVESEAHDRDGNVHTLLASAVLLYNEDGHAIGAMGTATDITERKRAERLEHEARERLQVLNQRVLDTQEAERRSIARELHDQIGQSLSALKLNLQILERQVDPSAAPLVKTSLHAADTVLQNVRELSLNLRPSALDDLGLVPALRWYLTRQAEAANIAIDIAVDEFEPRLSPRIETECFRIVQEAITNIVRHSHAQHIRLGVRREEALISISIRDDGAGFDVESMRKRATAGYSMGLLSMQDRASLMGAQLEIESAPGSGTEIRINLPLAPERVIGDEKIVEE